MQTVSISLLFYLFFLISHAQEDCLLASNGSRRLPQFVRPQRNTDRFQVAPIQAIITSYQFNCCGVITEWRAFVERSGGAHFSGQLYDISFQVWRPNSPSPVDTDGCYIMTGANIFSPIPLADPDTADRGIVTGRPSESERIEVQPGDVVGFYLDSRRDSNNDDDDDDGIQFDRDYTSESVWYDSGVATGGGTCQFPVGSQRTLSSSTNIAPLITATVSQSACPVSSTSILQLEPTSTTAAVAPTSTPAPPPSTSVPLPPTETSSQQPTPSNSINPSTPSVVGSGNGDNTALIAGFIVALILIIAIAALLIVIIIVVMKKRQSKQVSVDTTAWSNPSYEDPINVNGLTSSKGKKRSKQRAKPLSINVSGDGSAYEAVEGEYHGLPEALDYTYPTPSPTVKYDPNTDEVLILDKKGAAYHAQGPDTGNLYDYCGAEGPAAYQTVEPGSHYEVEPHSDSNQYDDPTLPKYRASTKNSLFEAHGTYVPTLAQRQTMGKHYELQEGDPNTPTYNKLQFFIEDQIYWPPAATASDLYQQLASKKYREIPRSEIIILEQLGSGQFGQVCKGMWSISNDTLQLAVKTLKPDAPEDQKVKFLQEAAIMGQFLHPNVVKLYGVVTVGEPVMICLEIMSSGDLRSYLRSIDIESSSARSSQDLQLLFLRFAKEIAAGMFYLSQKAFVHRDLAARNVLVNEALSCKIGDFGMARDLMDDTYYTSSGGKIPVKWTAPEALLYKKYSTDSDVWSYGMVLFEVWSVGKKPFSMHTNNEVLKLIQSGYVQCPPPGCPREMYKLMVDCWNPEHQYRPKFGEICSRLRASAGKLLYWSPQDNKLSKEAAVLGAALEEGYKLHGDLREKYKQYESI